MPRMRQRLVAGAISTLAAAMVCTLPTLTPHAAADPVSDAKSKLATIEQENSTIDSNYAAVQAKLAERRTQLKTTTADLARQQQKVESMATSATRVALAQFQQQGVGISTQLFTSPNADAFLNQLSTTQQIESNMNSTLQNYQSEAGSLQSLKKTVASEIQAISQDEQNLKDLQKQSEAKVAEAQALVDRLTAEQRAALQADQQQSNRTAASVVNSVSRSSSRAATADASSTTSDSSTSASSRAQGALAYAIAQVGKSYVMGAEGPNSFDCSGLTMAAYASVGISIPRTSQSQYGVGRSISRSELRAGDLVFFYSGISHVGIYLGNGIMVDARNSRVGVVYTNINEPWWPYAGARRIA